MNQPTEDRIKRLEEKVRKLEEQITEPIKITRLEIDQGGIQNRLDNHTEILKEISGKQDEQEQHLTLIYTDVGHMKTDIGVLKGKIERVESSVSTLKQTTERLETKMDELSQTVEKRFDAIAEVQKLILNRLPKGEGE